MIPLPCLSTYCGCKYLTIVKVHLNFCKLVGYPEERVYSKQYKINIATMNKRTNEQNEKTKGTHRIFSATLTSGQILPTHPPV